MSTVEQAAIAQGPATGPAAEPVQEQQDADSGDNSRRALALQDRFTLVDYLRGRIDPIVAPTFKRIAEIVSEQAGVDVSASQLTYMVKELPMYNLASKLIVVDENSPEAKLISLQQQIDKAVELAASTAAAHSSEAARLTKALELVDQLAGVVGQLEDRIRQLEAFKHGMQNS